MDGEPFSAAHRGQTVYHGPVAYSDDPYPPLDRASPDLELLLLLVFLKDAAHRGQRGYRFAVWTEEEPREDPLDPPVPPALIEAMQTPLLDPDGGGFVPAGVEESSTVEAIHGHPRTTLHVKALPAFVTSSLSTVASRRYDAPAKRLARDSVGLRGGRDAQRRGLPVGRPMQDSSERTFIGGDRPLSVSREGRRSGARPGVVCPRGGP